MRVPCGTKHGQNMIDCPWLTAKRVIQADTTNLSTFPDENGQQSALSGPIPRRAGISAGNYVAYFPERAAGYEEVPVLSVEPVRLPRLMHLSVLLHATSLMHYSQLAADT